MIPWGSKARRILDREWERALREQRWDDSAAFEVYLIERMRKRGYDVHVEAWFSRRGYGPSTVKVWLLSEVVEPPRARVLRKASLDTFRGLWLW
jgi:hypothetical protein